MSTAQEDAIRVRRDGNVGFLETNRISRRNSMDRVFVDQMFGALEEFDQDDDVRAILISGAGPGYCAGSDLKYLAPMTPVEMHSFEADCGRLGRYIGSIRKPVVAAVEGFAIGGGFTLATCCDVVVTSRNAIWHLPEVPIGWLTPWGIASLVNRVGPHRAKLLCYALDPMDGARAYEMGVADLLTDENNTLDLATQKAEQLAAMPSAAVESTKRFFSTYLLKEAEVMDVSANQFFKENVGSEDAQATLRKFEPSSSSCT